MIMKKYILEIASFLLLAVGIGLRATEAEFFQSSWMQFCYFVVAFLPVGLPVLKEAAEGIGKKDFFNECTLMALASFGAFYIGEYPEAVAVMLFYSVGEKLQDGAVDKARDHIRALMDVRPETARVLRNGNWETVRPEEVKVGDRLEIHAGERVPLDGTLLTDSANFDTAALTGESVPRLIEKDGEVLAGMIVTDKVIELVVTRPVGESALARILNMVEEASSRKAPAELFIRKISRIYTPVVILLAVLLVLVPYLYGLFTPSFHYHFNDWLYRSLVFLVISCPCALVVSIPLGYFAGIGTASRLGILFKGGNYLEAIIHVNAIVFDKTGTLTKGSFGVCGIRSASLPDKELLALVASVEQGSNHPIAQAVVREAMSQGLSLRKFDRLEEISGQGLKATTSDGHVYCVGNARMMKQEAIACPAENDKIEDLVICCAEDGIYQGCIVLADEVKDDSAEAVNELKAMKIDNIQILSGDKQEIVSRLARTLGIDKAYGNLLPQDKVAHMKELKEQGLRTSFVGDGMNDAPVLALSDVGIAMGGLGSDAAIETADVVIQTDQPHKVATAIRIGCFTRFITWQNIVFALGVKVVILLLGALGWANLWAAVFADVGVAMLAICNTFRIQAHDYHDR